jgi:alkylation response protein AidB-like acyl-CoA dehydrogenase
VNLLNRAESLTPLFRETAREAEIARRPLDRVINAVRESDLYGLMVPEQYGGHEADLDTFFEVVLTLSRADAAMGWLTGFYIEHNLWLLNYPQTVYEKVLDGNNHVLAPATLNMGGGTAHKVEGGYRLSGQWQWGTGIIHSTWVMAGGLVIEEGNPPTPTFFLLPTTNVEPIDTWHVTGMCATGSWDFKIDDVFVTDDHALPFQQFLNASSGITERLSGPLYSTPLMPVLGFAAGLPILGAAQMALAEFTDQVRKKIASNATRMGMPLADVSGFVGEAALTLEACETVMRNVLVQVMEKRNQSTDAERNYWLSRISWVAHTCRQVASQISAETGASGGHLSNPIQRAVRDISIATNHAVFAKSARYNEVGKAMLGQHAVDARK